MQVYNEIGFGEQHNQAAWRNRFPGAMRYLFPIEDEPSQLDPLSKVEDWNQFGS